MLVVPPVAAAAATTSQHPIVGVAASRVVPEISTGKYVLSGVPLRSRLPVLTARKSVDVDVNWLANVKDV